MSLSASQVVQQELEPQERLLWSDCPKQGVVFRGTDIFLIPFSLLWGGFAMFWEYTVFRSEAPAFFLAFGGVFVLVGLYFIFGRFLWDAASRRRTFYGLTNERVIILSGLLQKQVKSVNVHTLSNLTLSERAGREGTISLGPTSFMESMYAGMSWPGVQQGAPKLELIADAKRVFNLIRETQRA